MVPFAVAAACGGLTTTPTDAGSDGKTSGPCVTDSDCATAYRCMFDANGGCSATKICAPMGACKGMKACACDGTDVYSCGIGAPTPIAHLGSCNPDAIAPPPCSGVACEVCDVSGYSPTPQAKPIAKANLCPAADMLAFVTSCLGANATSSTCQTWQMAENTANASCFNCIFTQTTAASWGPVVCDNAGCTLNSGGCVDIVLAEISQEHSSGGAGSCGDLVSAETGCVEAACGMCSTPSDFSTCSQDALTGGCKTYVDAATNAPACGALDGGATACFPQTESDYTAFVSLFCGTGP